MVFGSVVSHREDLEDPKPEMPTFMSFCSSPLVQGFGGVDPRSRGRGFNRCDRRPEPKTVA
jgi:hypothetical protein